METIRKKICLDEFLSHRPGIMPYIKKDDDNHEIQYVDTITSDSNYGQFPCDFVLMSVTKRADLNTGLNYTDEKELSRLKYIDIINKYSKYFDKIENGKILRKIVFNDEKVEYLDCINSANTVSSIVQSVKWSPTKIDNISIFNCLPVDASFFILNNDGNYYFNENINNLKNSLLLKLGNIPQSRDEELTETLTEEELALLNKILYFGDGITSGALQDHEYIILLNDFDELNEYEKYWQDWWEYNFEQCSYYNIADRWEQIIFDAHYEEPEFFKFIYDVEKYILGRIKVPEINNDEVITGNKVPNYVYYLTFNDYLSWFENNAQYVNFNEEIKKKWDDLGGDAFYHLLLGIRPYFLNNLELPDVNVTGFTFVSPNIEIPLAFIDEAKTETLYKPYEISVDGDNNVFDGTFVYSIDSLNNIGSALTPTFKSFEAREVLVESRLDDLFSKNSYQLTDDICGIFSTFSSGGCLFRCENHRGTSSVSQIEEYYSGVVNEYGKRNGEWVIIKTIEIPETFKRIVRGEKMPIAANDVYQIVGIEKIDSIITTGNPTTVSATTVLPDGTIGVASAITTYQKEIENTYTWWECNKVNVEELSGYTCGDEDFNINDNYTYRNILLLSCIPSVSENKNKTYYYMATYDNGFTNIIRGNTIDTGTPKAMEIPYEMNVPQNVTTFDGEFSGITIYDMLTSEIYSNEDGKSIITLEYVLGATSGKSINSSGIHYKEKYNFKRNCVKKVIIDGTYEGEVLFKKIDRGTPEIVYSDDLMLERQAYLAEITGMEIGTQWTSASCINAYLYTEDDYDTMLENPQNNVNITFNRGNAAAWEKRFKLSECNTLEDLENYGNNYFNI